MFSNLIALGGLLGASAVALGAFGAHGLQARHIEPRMLKAWETAAHYQLLHSVVFLFLHNAKSTKPITAKLFFAGTLLFSGSLYALVLTDYKKLGMITPVGGILLICGWMSLLL